MGDIKALYKDIQSGKVKIDQLNDAGRAALDSYTKELKKVESLYNDIQAGKISIDQINDKGKAALNDYTSTLNMSTIQPTTQGQAVSPWLQKHPTLNKYIFEPINKLARAYEDTGAGKFNARASETALGILSATEPKNKTTTGNVVADTLASGVGLVGGFGTNLGGVGTSLGSAMFKAGKVGELAGMKVAQNAPKLVQKLAPIAAKGGAGFGAYEGGTALAQGKDAKEVAKATLEGIALGAAIDPAIETVLAPFAKTALSKIAGKLKTPLNKDIAEKAVAENIGVKWENMNDTQKAAIRKVVQNMQSEATQSGRLLETGQGFTFRDMKKSDIKGNVKIPTGDLQIYNKQLTEAEQKLEDATKYLQDYFQTNELRVSEMEYAKNTLGIDLEKLVDDVIKAEETGIPNVSRASERSRIARASGIEMPKLVRGVKETKIEQPKPTIMKTTIEQPKIYDKSPIPPTPVDFPKSQELGKLDLLEGINKETQKSINIPSSEMKPTEVKTTRQEPIIPEGLKERGFSKNVRTDANMNDQIRDTFSKEPLTYEQLANKTTLANAQARFSKGYETALADWNNSINTFRADDIPLSRMLSNEAAARGDMETARKIIADAADKLTQAGQFSQAARILRQAGVPGAFESYVQRQIKKLNEQGAKQYGKKWTGVSLTDDIFKKITNMTKVTEVEREKVMEEVYDSLVKQMPVTGMEKFDAWRRMAMLLNPKTHVRNIGGNVIMTGLRKAADTIGAGLEKAIGLKAGERTKSIGWSADKNIISTVEKEWQTSKKELLQTGRWDIESLSFMNREKPIFENKLLEKTNQLSKDLLNAGDAPFVARAYKDALGQYIKSNKLTAATEEAKEYAKRRAFEATFKQTNLLSDFINKAKRAKGIGPFVEAAIPFSKTPANIAARAFEYSPAGLVKALYSKTSGKTNADVIEDLAKGLTGSSIAGLGFMLADMGWIRSEKSKSKNVEAILQQMGDQPNSILTPLGSYTFDWAQPFSVPLAMGIVTYENLYKKDEIDLQALVDAVAAGSDTIFSMSMLQNITQLFGGYGSVTEKLAELPASYAVQAFPTVLGQIARTADSTRRSTYDPNPLKQFGKGVIAKTPFASKTLEPRLDVFGKEQEQGGALQHFLSPGYWKEKSDDPVTKEIVRLYKSTKDTTILPKVAPLYIMSGGKKITLLPAQVTQFQREMGESNYKDIKNYLSTTSGASDEQKAKKLAKIVKNNYDKTKKKYIPKE